jgi:single-strand DNA-binding protein
VSVSGSINRVIIVGNLGQDPESKTTASGQLVANFSVATSETYTDKAGARQEKTEWHRCVAWGKQAEFVQKFLKRGRKVCVEGKLETRSWEDQGTGQKRYATEIIAQHVTGLDSAGAGQEQGQQRPQGGGQKPAQGGYGGGQSTDADYDPNHVPF